MQDKHSVLSVNLDMIIFAQFVHEWTADFSVRIPISDIRISCLKEERVASAKNRYQKVIV